MTCKVRATLTVPVPHELPTDRPSQESDHKSYHNRNHANLTPPPALSKANHVICNCLSSLRLDECIK